MQPDLRGVMCVWTGTAIAMLFRARIAVWAVGGYHFTAEMFLAAMSEAVVALVFL